MKTQVNEQKVKDLREKRGWSQNQLAEMASISLRTIQRMEKDGTCSIESVKSIASVFEIDFKELLLTQQSERFDGVDFLVRIEHGKQLSDLVGGRHATDFDFEPTIKDNGLIEEIHSLFQNVSDYNDIWGDIEYGGRTEAIAYFQEALDNLAQKGLWVFGGLSKRKIGNYFPDMIFDVIALRVYTSSSSSVIKVDLDRPNVSSVH